MVADGVAGVEIVDQLRQSFLGLPAAQRHRLSAGQLGILIGIARREVLQVGAFAK